MKANEIRTETGRSTREPNSLSNSALRCFGVCADVHLSLRAGVKNVGERPRTAATETKTETTVCVGPNTFCSLRNTGVRI